MSGVTDLEEMTDEDIIGEIRNGRQEAMDYLLEKYKNLVRQKARTLFMIGGDNEDLIQEGMIGLYKAIRDYKEKDDNIFFSFAELCITRQLFTAIKASNRKKNIPLNTYISLNTPVHKTEDSEEDIVLSEVVLKDKIQNPEEMVIDKENTDMIKYELERRLSKFEREVFVRYMDGDKYTQIAEALGKEPKSIDNALQRIRSKVTEILNTVE